MLVHHTRYTLLRNDQSLWHFLQCIDAICTFTMNFPHFSEASFTDNMIIGKTVWTVLDNFVNWFLLFFGVYCLSLGLMIWMISWRMLLFLSLVLLFYFGSWAFLQNGQDSLMIAFDKWWRFLHVIVHPKRLFWLSVCHFWFFDKGNVWDRPSVGLFSHFLVEFLFWLQHYRIVHFT